MDTKHRLIAGLLNRVQFEKHSFRRSYFLSME
jgi:hypothetical protein